jgi:hypothetical protein
MVDWGMPAAARLLRAERQERVRRVAERSVLDDADVWSVRSVVGRRHLLCGLTARHFLTKSSSRS